jgi:Zn-dependent protease
MILITVLAIWLVSLCLHEYSHARVAYAGGDHTVVEKGYLTMNPLRYMNPMLSIVLPAIFLLLGGIALPGGAVWINRGLLRSRGWQSMVSLAGPLANIVCCVILGIPFLLGLAEDTTMWAILAVSCGLQASAFVLNMLPIPGLDGYGVIEPWLPPEAQDWGRRFAQYGFFILVILFLAVPEFGAFFWKVVLTFVVEVLNVDFGLFLKGLRGVSLLGR